MERDIHVHMVESGYNIYLANILDSLSSLITLLGRHVNSLYWTYNNNNTQHVNIIMSLYTKINNKLNYKQMYNIQGSCLKASSIPCYYNLIDTYKYSKHVL